jgi:NAD(P)-dependent dehydrogenase (short-subunit alcohol dehydrogenase family)
MPGGDYLYRSSKAALNASARSLAFDLKSQGISILILHPGYVRTKSTGFKADISASESVEGMRSVIHSFSLEKTGVFLDYTGQPVPW